MVFALDLFMSPDPKVHLYNQFYEPLSDEVFDQEMTRGETDARIFEGIQSYLEGDYFGAIQILERNPEGGFVLSLSQLGLRQHEDALVSLKRYHTDQPDHPDALWYLGLTSLRTGNIN